MKKILLLSDSHSYIDDRILDYASQADEIWHCGDFGNPEVIEKLEKITTLRGVYGNIDGEKVRKIFPEISRFTVENVEVLMIHIGGYPGKYSPLTKKEIAEKAPNLFISGHSHILKAANIKRSSKTGALTASSFCSANDAYSTSVASYSGTLATIGR